MAVPRRVVTGHDAAGRSVVLSDGPVPKSHAIPSAVFHEIWSTGETPAPIRPEEPADPTARPLRTPPDPNGTVIRIVDINPHAASPMHRTESVDCGILLEGEIHLILDDGSETRLGPGDVVVQRGTDHAWENRTDSVTRIAFILIDGKFTNEVRERLPAEALEHLFSQQLD
ncbi:MAG TPA: cupin domain-containing protein [Thermoleophilaceae bacterium]